MGGRAWVESEVGTGSTFHVTMQMARTEEPVSRPDPVSPAVLEGQSVLVVDDHETNRRFVQVTLAGWGMKPALATGAESAVAALRGAAAAGRPSRLVLLDAHMPGGDGLSVVERLRGDPALDPGSIILLTSDLRAGDLQRCRALGIVRHLVKPITPSELLAALVQTLGDAAPRPSASAAPPAPPVGRPLRVLVAEDNRVNQVLITRMLQKLNHVPVVCSNGLEALAAFGAQPFDLVLMDVQMPEMDGLSATGAIRQYEADHGAVRRVPIIALTASAMQGDREECLAAGMDDYLTKPLRGEELVAALARVGGDPPV
jgi:CheY-like chemotaxis protein